MPVKLVTTSTTTTTTTTTTIANTKCSNLNRINKEYELLKQ